MPLSRAGSRIASGAALGAVLALAFAAFAVVITWVAARSSWEGLAPTRVAMERTAESWPNAPGVPATDAGSPRLPVVDTPTAEAITERLTDPAPANGADLSEALRMAFAGIDAAADRDATEAVAGADGADSADGADGADGADEEPAAIAATAGAPPSEPIESSATCGAVTCPSGQVCCNPSCGICAPPGEKCNQFVCGMSALAMSVTCGPNTCNVGEVCCNPTCGICTPPGGQCDTRPCPNPPVIPFSETCGLATCNVGMVCCNPSCGICAKPGVPCRREPC